MFLIWRKDGQQKQATPCAMASAIFRCPATSMNVQHWLDDDQDVPENEYEVITCLACTKLHLINRKTGKILGQGEK
jgi:hypothetical protein